MQWRDNGLGFSPVTIALHWIVAALLVAILGLEIVMAAGRGRAADTGLAEVQNLLGLVLFLVSIYRFYARITSFHPLPVGTPNPVEVIIGRSVAAALALAMVLLPAAVWLSRAAGGEAVVLPGGHALPRLIDPAPGLKALVDTLFAIGGAAFLAGLALHLFGAWKNHVVLKTPAVQRMLGKHVEL
ncbi:MAG: cytochrome B [Tistrella sp.]|uniref:cytochrome b n=1 Tax=Tistrella sp. TaxID=2024861 RepID=UPI000C4B37ED|nr:cytochrome b/b6 domain-containing protein [Tistrella sp.]MAD38965.1 cytochrome B [Tistrella sp.]MBA73811.1 cytochrome B [Tistrella sp.]